MAEDWNARMGHEVFSLFSTAIGKFATAYENGERFFCLAEKLCIAVARHLVAWNSPDSSSQINHFLVNYR